MAHLSGVEGDLIAGGTSLNVKEWTIGFNSEPLDTTDKGDSGWMTKIGGLKSAELSASGDYDDAINNEDPPNVRPGQSISFEAELHDSGESITGTFLVTSFEYTSAVDGKAEWTMSGESTGQVYLPNESTS